MRKGTGARFDPVLAAILARLAGSRRNVGRRVDAEWRQFPRGAGIAPGSFASAFASFSTPPDAVQVGGKAANVLGVYGSQINFVVPEGLSPGTVPVSLTAGGKPIANGQVAITAASPGIFVLRYPDTTGTVLNQDSTVNGPTNPAAKDP